MQLILASNNKGKIAEISALLPRFSIKTMKEIGYETEIPEPFITFQENAHQKARTIYDWCHQPVLADDSGLCVNALDGAPGVFSARYAGVNASDADNNGKLLAALQKVSDRSACYIAVLCLIIDGNAHFFEGSCEGTIAETLQGNKGFGYDPLFIPNGYDTTFGMLDGTVKRNISHRAKALKALIDSGLLHSI